MGGPSLTAVIIEEAETTSRLPIIHVLLIVKKMFTTQTLHNIYTYLLCE